MRRLNLKVETISINILARKMYHAKSSGINTTEYPKKEGGFYHKVLAYIEEHCTKNGFEIINVHGSDRMYIFHLVQQ